MMKRLPYFINRNRWFIAVELAALGVIATFFLNGGGGDMRVYYLPFAQGCLECGYVPYFAYWFLWPLALLPPQSVYAIWTAITLTILLAIVYRRQANPLILLFSFPMAAQIWVGQIDALVILGIALAMGLFSPNPHVRGFGLLMAAIKPQLSALFMLTLAWQMRGQFLRLLPVPLIAALLSFLHFGWDWPLRWWMQAQTLPVHMYRQTALLIFPWGLLTLLTPFIMRQKDRQLQTATLAATTIPQYSIYSYILFMAFLKPALWWSVPLSYVWLLALPWLGADAHLIEIIFPLLLLAYFIWVEYFKKG